MPANVTVEVDVEPKGPPSPKPVDPAAATATDLYADLATGAAVFAARAKEAVALSGIAALSDPARALDARIVRRPTEADPVMLCERLDGSAVCIVAEHGGGLAWVELPL